MSSVSVVVLNYRRSLETIECLDALRRSSYAPLKIVVVDNASNDNSVPAIKRAHPDVTILESPDNAGYAGGMNLGLRYILQEMSEYVLILNSDTVVEKDFVARLLEVLDTETDAAAASGTIYYYPELSRVWYGGGGITYWRASAFSRKERITDHASNTVQRVTFVSGCAFLIRTSVLRKVGLFDERFFMYLEDTELCHRLRVAGYGLLYVPDAAVLHRVEHHGELPLPLYYSVRNRFLFTSLTTRGVIRITAFTYLILTLCIKSLRWMMTRPVLIRASICGIRDFLAHKYFAGSGLQFSNRGNARIRQQSMAT